MIHAPIRYFGGKGTMIKSILTEFPGTGTYDTFIDAYGGSGVVLLNKPYVPIEIFNDLDENVYSLYSAMQDPVLFEEFKRRADLSIFSEQQAHTSRRVLKQANLHLLDRAYHFWYASRVFRTGKGGLAFNKYVRRNMSKSASDMLSSVDRMPELHHRLSSVIVLNRDAIELITAHDQSNVMIYADPPYHHDTRGSTRYDTDADADHHEQLVGALMALEKARVLISGYDHTVYDPLVDSGWNKISFSVSTVDSRNRPKDKTETLWRNYDIVDTLPLFSL